MSKYTYSNKSSDSIFEESHANIMDSLALALIIAKATTLARIGMLKQAETILQPIAITAKASEDVYVLLAKIKAQQGKYFESKQMWQRVLTKNPFHTEAKKAIKKINRFSHKAQKSTLLRYAILFGIVFNSGLIFFNWSMNNQTQWSMNSFSIEQFQTSIFKVIETVKSHEYYSYITKKLNSTENDIQETTTLPDFQLLSPEKIDYSNINNQAGFPSDNIISVPDDETLLMEPTHSPVTKDQKTIDRAISLLADNHLVKQYTLKIEKNKNSIAISGLVPSIQIRNQVIQAALKTVERQSIHADHLHVIANYTVQRGDSLWNIAAKFYKDPHKFTILAKHNQLSPNNPLWVGLKIEIPNPIVEVVQDTE